MSKTKTIAKNSAAMLTANIGKKILTTVLIMVVARYLGAEEFGRLSFATSFVALFTIIIDFGAKTLINREIARNKEQVNTYVSNIFLIKAGMSFILLWVVYVAATLLSYPSATIILVMIAAIMYVFQSLGTPFESAMRGFEKMHLQAIAIIVEQVIKIGFAIAAIVSGLGILHILVIYALSSCIGLIIRILLYHHYIEVFSFEFSVSTAKNLIVKSIPFGVGSLMMMLYDKLDITMLSKLVLNPDLAIGWYSASYNLLYVFEFIPLSISAAVYPAMSIAFLKDKKFFENTYKKVFTYANLLTIPICFGTLVTSNKIIALIYGSDFGPSVLALQILIWSIFFKFQMYTFGLVLNSMNKEVLTMKATIVSLIINVILNLLLIPTFSFIGASIATVVSELIYFGICFVTISKNIENNSYLLDIIKPIIGALPIVAIGFYFNYLNVFLIIFIAGLVYLLMIWYLKAIPKDDIHMVKTFIRSFIKDRSFVSK